MKRSLSPKSIVSFIDRYFPEANMSPDKADRVIVGQRRGSFENLLDFIKTLPDELLPTDDDDYILLSQATSHIRAVLDEISEGGGDRELKHIPVSGRKNALVEIRRILKNCPEQFIPPEIAGLDFVKDLAYRTMLREDLSEFESYLQHRHWKAATVLGGSLLEAVLLDMLSGVKHKAIKAKSAPKQKGEVKDLEDWGLHSCLEVAHELEMIGDATHEIGMCAKDARNLIHPGRAIRLALDFDSGTAYSVKAALENAFRDLKSGTVRGKGP
ncbi:hypothetical protein MYX84_15415 [Acidobacteria bacterium AH-259-O06]|nr:hypothetical protein [Acidobacteria bacterium AH-259-O06]